MKKGAASGARARAAPPPTSASKPGSSAAVLSMPPSHDGNMSASTLMRMQAGVGNAATAAMVGQHLPAQRLAGSTAPPVPPPGTRADQDPAFVSVRGKVTAHGRSLKKHPQAAAEASKASAAAQAPANDKESQAKAARVDEMGEAKPGTFDKVGFIAAVRKAVEASAPKTLEEADDFAGSGKAGQIKGQVTGQVTAGKESTTGDVKAKTAQPPDPSVAEEKCVTPLDSPPPVKTPTVPASGAMPKPAPPEQLDLDGAKHETDGTMATAEVTEGQLANSNEPEFQDALAVKQEGEQHSAAAPVEMRATEGPLLAEAQTGASSSAAQALGAMATAKRGGNARVGASKSSAKSNEEMERRQVADQIESIFATTKKDTEAILAGIDPQVESEFTKGEAEARAAFEQSQSSQMKAWKDVRYDGVRGKVRWGWDKIKGPPAKVNEFFARAREIYVEKLGHSIARIADLIGRELTRARERIAKGKSDVRTFVAKQKGNLAKYAAEAQESIGGRFDELEQGVEDKQGELVDDLAAKYNEAQGAIDERIAALQAENMGLWDRAKAAIGGAIKTIMQLKDMLLGVFARVATAVSKIMADPIGFLGKMVNAVKAGLDLFIDKLPKHLANGLKGWLLGSMGDAGLEIPSAFDLTGILKLVLSMIGATADTVRSQIVKRIGAPAMNALERAGGFVSNAIKQAANGTWEFVVEKVGDIKTKIMGKIQEYLQKEVLMAGPDLAAQPAQPGSRIHQGVQGDLQPRHVLHREGRGDQGDHRLGPRLDRRSALGRRRQGRPTHRADARQGGAGADRPSCCGPQPRRCRREGPQHLRDIPQAGQEGDRLRRRQGREDGQGHPCPDQAQQARHSRRQGKGQGEGRRRQGEGRRGQGEDEGQGRRRQGQDEGAQGRLSHIARRSASRVAVFGGSPEQQHTSPIDPKAWHGR